MSFPSLAWPLVLGVAGTAFVGGVSRGLTGFGNALVMAPVLMLMMPAEQAVVIISLNNLATSGQFMRRSWALADRSLLWPMLLAALPAIPVGVGLIGWVAPELARRATGAAVMVLCLLLLFRPHAFGAPRPLKTVLVGIASGLLTGFGGIGGPPSVLYVMGHAPDPDRARATFIVYFSALYVAAAIIVGAMGLVGFTELALALVALPAFLAGGAAGARLFPLVASTRYREIVLAMLLLTGALAAFR